MCKKVRIISFIMVLLIISSFILKDTLAISSISRYDFYIKENIAYGDEGKIILADTIDEKTLTKGKIAPRHKWKF